MKGITKAPFHARQVNGFYCEYKESVDCGFRLSTATNNFLRNYLLSSLVEY